MEGDHRMGGENMESEEGGERKDEGETGKEAGAVGGDEELESDEEMGADEGSEGEGGNKERKNDEERVGGEADNDDEVGGNEAGENGEAGDDEEDEDTPLLFDADLPVDPLSLVETQDEPGHEYERYTKLQYEMLAERKRKALGGGESPSQSSPKRQKSALYGASVDDIYGSKGELDQHFDKQEERRRGRRGLERKRGRRPGARGLPVDVTKKLGRANLFYATEQYQEAVEVLVEVVRMAPNVADSYHTLGLCHEALGDRRKALNFYMIAAHLTPRDTSLWRRLATWSTEQNNPAQAIHCLTKVVRFEPDDVDARWDRAVLMTEVGDFRKACSEFEKLHAERPADVEVAKMLARMFHKLGHAHKATNVLEAVIERLPPHQVDLTAVNILAELHMEAGAFGAATSAMTSARNKLGTALPPDLEVKLGICYAYLGDFEAAKAHTEPLRQAASEECSDLYMDVGDAYAAVGRPHDALRFYSVLARFLAYSQPALWLKMGQCLAQVGEYEGAVEKLTRVLTELPDDLDARIALSDALMHLRRFEEGLRVLEPAARVDPTSETEPWWESVRVRIMRARFQLAQGAVDAFLDAALPLVEETIEEEFEARQRRALEARRPQPTRSNLDAPNTTTKNPADVFAGYQPTRQTRKKAKTKRERLAAKAAAEAAAQGVAESGVDAPPAEPGVDTPLTDPGRENGLKAALAGPDLNMFPAKADANTREDPSAIAPSASAGAGTSEENPAEKGAEAEPNDVNLDARGLADVSGNAGKQADVNGDAQGHSDVSGGDARGHANVSRDAQEGADVSEDAAAAARDGVLTPEEAPGRNTVPLPDIFTSADSFRLLHEVVKGLAESGRVRQASGIVQRVLLLGRNAPPGKRLSGEQRRALKLLTAGVEYTERMTGDRERDTLRIRCNNEPYDLGLWSALNAKAIRSGDYLPYRKWLFKLRKSHLTSVPIAMLCGHQHTCGQKFGAALREYQRAHAQMPDEPLISLCIGLAFLHHAMNRRTSHRNRAVLQGFAFLYEYHRLEGGSQEADFNLGRAYHQMGLVHLAVPYYEKALSAGLRPSRERGLSAVAGDVSGGQGLESRGQEGPGSFAQDGTKEADTSTPVPADVTRRAAHNLALIFRKSGAHLLAEQLRRDFLSEGAED